MAAARTFSDLSSEARKALVAFMEAQGGSGPMTEPRMKELIKWFNSMRGDQQALVVAQANEAGAVAAATRQGNVPKAPPTKVTRTMKVGETVTLDLSQGTVVQPTPAATAKVTPKVATPVRKIAQGAPVDVPGPIMGQQLDAAADVGAKGAAGAATEAGVAAELAGQTSGGGDDLKKLVDLMEDGRYAGRKPTARSVKAMKRWFIKELNLIGQTPGPTGRAARILALEAGRLPSNVVLNQKFANRIAGMLNKKEAQPLLDLWTRTRGRLGGIRDHVLRREFDKILHVIKKVAPDDVFLIEQLKKLGPRGLSRAGARRGIETIGTITEGGLFNKILVGLKIKGPRPSVSPDIMAAAQQARGAQNSPSLLNELSQKVPGKRLRGWVQKWNLTKEVIPDVAAKVDPKALAELAKAGARVPSKLGRIAAIGSSFKGVLGALAVPALLYEGWRTYDLIVNAKERAQSIRDSGVMPGTGEQLLSVTLLKDRLKRNEALTRRRQMLVSQPDLFAQVMGALGNDSPAASDSSYRFGPATESSFDKALGQKLGKSDYNARLNYLLSQMGG